MPKQTIGNYTLNEADEFRKNNGLISTNSEEIDRLLMDRNTRPDSIIKKLDSIIETAETLREQIYNAE